MAVSIIVPVYNAEKTLERCLLSIQNQTYKDIEVIVVNDGSTDGSIGIINKFVSSDSRFKFIEKGNTGVSDTRNKGIENATGEFLQFVDSDDYLKEDSTMSFVLAAEKYDADMIISDFYRVYSHSVVVMGSIPKFEGVMSCSEFATEMMKAPSNFYYGVMWNKFYRRDIVSGRKLSCVTELNWCEDFMFNIEYLYYAERIAVIHNPSYYYVKRPGSLVSTETGFSSAIKMKKFVFSYYKELYDRLELYSEHKLKIKKFYIEFARDKILKQEKKGKNKEKSIQTAKFSTTRKRGEKRKKNQKTIEGQVPVFKG